MKIHILWLLAASILLVSCQNETIIDAQIVGHSMAPAFKGSHGRARCKQCGFAWTCDAVDDRVKDASPSRLTCPNCGVPSGRFVASGQPDKIEVVADQPIARWDVVACQANRKSLIKRVLGLPGETIDFLDGDLLVDGQRVTKPQRVLEDLTYKVFDSSFVNAAPDQGPPRPDERMSMFLVDRLVPKKAKAWSFTETSVAHVAQNSSVEPEQFDWLTYQHWRGYSAIQGNSRHPCFVDDAYPFNSTLRRNVNQVHDLIVEAEIDCPPGQPYSFQIKRANGSESFNAQVTRFDSTQPLRCRITISGDDAFTIIKDVPQANRQQNAQRIKVGLANLDGVVTMLIDDQIVLSGPIAANHTWLNSTVPPGLLFGVPANATVTLKRVKIFRDNYLFQPVVHPSLALPVTLGRGEYFVVGDNLPVSDDSRTFGAVSKILGVVRRKD